jgi:hypothetical protein
MTYKPFRDSRYAATAATNATDVDTPVARVAEVAVVAAEQRLNFPEYEERAAICEYDGGLSRDHAEQLAALCAMPIPDGAAEQQCAIVINAAARFLDRRRRAG